MKEEIGDYKCEYDAEKYDLKEESIEFKIRGHTPVAQGSMRAFMQKGFPVIVHVNSYDLKKWRKVITDAGLEELAKNPGFGKLDVGEMYAYYLYVIIYLQRPKSIDKEKRPFHNKKSDLDKLARSFGDSFSNFLIQDDSEINEMYMKKVYVDTEEEEGCDVILTKKYLVSRQL